MARRTVLTRQQRSARVAFPPRAAARLRRDTMSNEALQHIGARRRHRNKRGVALPPRTVRAESNTVSVPT